MNKTSQKHVTNVNNFLLKTFKTSTELHNSLKRDKNTTTSSLTTSTAFGMETKKSREIGGHGSFKKERTNSMPVDPDYQNFLGTCDIKQLENYKKMDISEKNLDIIK